MASLPAPSVPEEDGRPSHIDVAGSNPLADLVEVNSTRTQIPPLHAVEALIGQGRWGAVAEQLAPFEAVLPPAHRLLYALALRESGADGDEARRADALAIGSLAALLDVPESSPVALLLARRMQRRAWRHAPAPRPRVQAALVVAAVLLGAFVGWAWDEYNDRRAQHPAAAEPGAVTE